MRWLAAGIVVVALALTALLAGPASRKLPVFADRHLPPGSPKPPDREFLLSPPAGGGSPSAPAFSATFGNYGIASLAYNGATLYDGDANPADRFQVGFCTLVKPDGTRTTAWPKTPTTHWDAAARTVTWDLGWGTIDCRYTVGADRLGIRIAVSNRSATDTIAGVNVLPMALRFPARPVGWDAGGPVAFGWTGPSVVTGDYRGGEVALVNADQSGTPLYVGFQGAGKLTETANRYLLRIGTTPTGSEPTSHPTFDRPLAPGATATYDVSLRVAASGTRLDTIAGDAVADYVRRHPYRVDWADRRPISWLFPAGSGPASRSATNPSGWFNDPTVDVTTPAGLAAFRTRLLAYADNAVAMLERVGGQGAITWDVEGERYAAINYVGDPRLAETLSPELTYRGVLDAYFKKFTDAGLRVGVTIRPDAVVMRDGVGVGHAVVPDVAAELTAKVRYARRRWGATLFYIDSTDQMMDGAVLGRVTAACPGVLLIPENSNVGTAAYAAPYGELRRGATGTPAAVRAVYPEAFGVIVTAGTKDVAGYAALLKASAAGGDILMFTGWYDAADVAVVRDVYRSLNRPATPTPATPTPATSSPATTTAPAGARAFSSQPVLGGDAGGDAVAFSAADDEATTDRRRTA